MDPGKLGASVGCAPTMSCFSQGLHSSSDGMRSARSKTASWMRRWGETWIVYQTESPSSVTAWCDSSTLRLIGRRSGFASAAARNRAASIAMSVTKSSLNSVAMTGRDRVEAALAMQVADRPPVGAWGHTYREEWSPDDLAAVTVERARRYGWDFVKFQPRASCFAEAFGSIYRPSGHRLRAPVLIKPAVPDLDAWASVRVSSRQALDDQVRSIGLVARALGPDVPVIQTVFSPITVGGYLVGKSQSRVVRELRKQPELVGPALERIAEELLDFSRRSIDAGAAGIFYAISGYAGRKVMPEAADRDLVLPYDLAVLIGLPKKAWFNAVHLCGSNLNFGLARDLPAQAVSWSIHNQGNPSLAEGRAIAGRAVMGGLSQRATLVYGPPPKIEAEARAAVEETGGRGLILAPGCSVPPRVREVNLEAMAMAVAA